MTLQKGTLFLSHDAKFDEHSFDASHTASPSSNPTLHDPFPSLEIHPLISPPPSTSSTSSHLPSTSKQPPKWVRTLLQNSGFSTSDVHASSPRKLRSHDTVNVALMAHIHDIYEPNTVEEALALPQWKEAMQEEYHSILANHTWELVPRPSHRKVIGVKWLFKVKLHSDGSLDKYKARLIAKGYAQQEGEDFDETFAPTARYSTICIVLALASHFQWRIFQMDIKSAFLNGDLEEEVYVEQPPGFEVSNWPNHVCLLKKSLYGLKQAPQAWYIKIYSFLLSIDFQRTHADSNLYVLVADNDICILVLYVDDLIITGSNMELITWVQHQLTSSFFMTNLGLLHYFLGLEVWQHASGIFISRRKYSLKLLEKFNMQNSASISCPMDPHSKLSIHDESPE